MPEYYISITGFTLKSMLYLPKFMAYSIPAARQAASAEGNVLSEQRYIDGVLHTLSAWDDKASMRRYMLRGAHAKAMKITRDIGNLEYGTKTYGYESDNIPTWDEAIRLWHEKATLHGKPMASKASSNNKSIQSTSSSGSSVGTKLSVPPLAGSQVVVPFLVSCVVWLGLHVIKQSQVSFFS